MIYLEQLSAFHFLRPWWLLGFIPLLLTMLYAWQASEPVAQWQRTIAPHLLKALTVKGGHGHWFNPISLSVLVIFLGVIALAGPSWERKASPFVEDEAVLVIALELSNSMNQTDVQPTRLERTKQKVMDLLALRKGARTGLIVYSGTAHRVIPLTSDLEIINQFLNALVTGMMPVEGKFPEKVLPVADQMLQESRVPGTVLLIADGVSPASSDAFQAYFTDAAHQLVVLGVGLEILPETIDAEALFDGIHLPLQATELEKLASVSGGSYQALTLDKTDVVRINRRVNNHLSNVEDSNRPWVDAGYYLIFPFALVFLFWFRKGWTLHWCALLLLVNMVSYSPYGIADASDIEEPVAVSVQGRLWQSFVNLWLTPDQQGRYAFEQGDYAAASQHFNDTAWKGIAFYYNENFAAAKELFSQIDTTDGLFNLANAQAQGQLYLDAVRTYDRVLNANPDHQGTAKNKAIVQAIIDEINQMSESQQPEAGEAIKELGDAPKRSDGAEKKEAFDTPVKQYTAEQLLADQQLQDLWMRQIQQDPSRFLSVKFQMQLNQKQSQGEDNE